MNFHKKIKELIKSELKLINKDSTKKKYLEEIFNLSKKYSRLDKVKKKVIVKKTKPKISNYFYQSSSYSINKNGKTETYNYINDNGKITKSHKKNGKDLV